IDQYNSRIHSVVKRFFNTDSNVDVDDVKQDVYVKVWKNLSKCRNDSNLWGWISTITVNTCKDHLKRSRKFSFVSNSEEFDIVNSIPDKKSETGKNIEQLEKQKMILNSINKLGKKHREVIIYNDIDELTYEEIAKIVNCPIGTVKSRLFTARKVLYQELKDLIN
ncbi:MAG: sigma-70 family RNA polymerase sigma factor, partial [Candidatus Gastranaerophilales bacterium]|nr:sigma-70 family RNA polymerase sigma factor [Candidatus Gastranaerophilales bacterium]